MSVNMTAEQRILWRNRKERYMKQVVRGLQHIGKNVTVREDVFNDIRENLTRLEVLHTDDGKNWLKAERIFFEKYNIKRFCESEHGVSYQHLMACKRGDKNYSASLKQAIVNYIQNTDI